MENRVINKKIGKMRCEYVSLCKVITVRDKKDDSEVFRLLRIADIKYGELIKFCQQNYEYRTFDNRSTEQRLS